MTNYDYPAHMLTKDGRIKKSKLKAAAQWRATHSKSKTKLVCYTRTAKDGHRYVTCNHPSHKHGAAKRHTAKPKAATSRPRNPATQPKKPSYRAERFLLGDPSYMRGHLYDSKKFRTAREGAAAQFMAAYGPQPDAFV